MLRKPETSECDQSCSDSWASTLISKLDQFQHEKVMPKTLATQFLEIDIMDDFLEMDRVAAVFEIVNKAFSLISDVVVDYSSSEENPLSPEYETLSQRVVELEQKMKRIEADKLKDAQIIEEMQKELDVVNELKKLLEFQLSRMEIESRTMSANIDSLKTEFKRKRSLSSDKETKCQDLENERRRKSQDDVVVGADKLAKCQKTIASLRKQLHSLATLEDLLIDTTNLSGFSGEGSVVAGASGEEWKLHVNETFTRNNNSDTPKIENSSHSMNGNEGESSSSSSSSSSATEVTTSKSRNGFGKLFS
ncbi:hypothetical protein H5410_050978 [Solanum commersonii]|uniref:Uncharacterized protein n=1 Tax=Solanum commersonii TaxID=4109 RepID=A0A9J5WYA6_SOLCO|nr:hypothetical protein H5410_050978 [Solanum commersonii]